MVIVKPIQNKQDVIVNLWVLSEKIRGFGELFEMACGDPPLSAEALKGIGKVLRECAIELEHSSWFLEYGQSYLKEMQSDYDDLAKALSLVETYRSRQ